LTSGRTENGEEKLHVFKSIQWQEKKSIVVVQVSIAEGKHNGPKNLAKQHIMSETSLQLCYMIIND
jgi:hypothetical protein